MREPIDHWLDQVRSREDEKHMETVKWLKDEYGMGHGPFVSRSAIL